MAIHRLKKEKDFLIIDNSVLRDPTLSLKAKGLLAYMLSRPDDWVFSVKGLANASKDGIDSVRAAITELEKRGHLVRTRVRSHGRYQEVVYDIYERPIPVQEIPTQVKTKKAVPDEEKEAIPNTDLSSTDIPMTESIKNPSTNPDGTVEKRIRAQMEYDILCQQYDHRLLNDIVSVMTEMMIIEKSNIHIGKDRAYPIEYVRSCMEKIGPMHIQQIMDYMAENQPTVRNIRGYLLAALINAANTMDMGYQYGE